MNFFQQKTSINIQKKTKKMYFHAKTPVLSSFPHCLLVLAPISSCSFQISSCSPVLCLFPGAVPAQLMLFRCDQKGGGVFCLLEQSLFPTFCLISKNRLYHRS